jgi:hypothetical protein
LFFLRFVALLWFVNAGGNDYDSSFALAHEPIQFAPCVEAGDASRVRALHRNQELVVPGVAVKLRHSIQPSTKDVTAAGCIGFGGKGGNAGLDLLG